MISKNIKIRFILFVIITSVFVSAYFYYFFRNSRAAGSPLKDKDYMEQVANLSKRYNVAGEPVITPSPTPISEKKQNIVAAFSISILEFLTNLIK